jgi:hypothetical protein
LGGLPSYLTALKHIPIIEFDPYNLDEVKLSFSSIMPAFREWIETKRKQEFFEALGKIFIGGLAVYGLIKIISGIAGALSGSSKK